MTIATRTLKLRLDLEYAGGAGLKAAVADIMAVESAASASGEGLAAAALSITDLDSAAADASVGLAEAALAAQDLAAAGDELSAIDPSGLEATAVAADTAREASLGLKDSLSGIGSGDIPQLTDDVEGLGRKEDETSEKGRGLRDVLGELKDRAGPLRDSLGGVGSAVSDAGSRLGSLAGGLLKPLAIGGAAAVGLLGLVGAGALKLGDDFDGAYDTIQIQTGLTGEALTRLQGTVSDVFSQVPTDLESATTAVAGFGSALDIVGDVEALSVQVLNLSRITGTDVAVNTETAIDTFARWKISADDQSAALDLLFEASQRARIPFDQLAAAVNDNAAALSSAGLDYEQSVELVTRLSAAGLDATSVMPGLSRVLVEAAKEGRSGSDALADLVANISGAGSSAAAEKLAVDGFGKSGIKMAQAIRDGTLSLADLQGGLSRADGQINSTAGSTDDFAQKLLVMKNKALVALEPFGAAALSAGNNLVDALGPSVSNITERVGDFGARFREVLEESDFGPVTGPIAALGRALSDTFPAADSVGVALRTLALMGERIISSFGDGGVKGVLADLPQIFESLGIDPAIADSVLHLVDVIREQFGGLADASGDFSAESLIAGLVDGLSSALPVVVDFVSKVVEFLGFLLEHRETVVKILGLFAGFQILAPLIPIVSALGSAFVALMGFLAPAGVAVTGIGSALGVLATILTGPVGLAIAAVIGAFALWRLKGDEIKAWLAGFGADVRAFFDRLGDFKLPSLDLGAMFGGAAIKPLVIPPPDTSGISDARRIWEDFQEGFNRDWKGAALLERVGFGFSHLANSIDDSHLDGALAPLQDAIFSFSDSAGTAFENAGGVWRTFQKQLSDFDISPLDALSNALGTVGEQNGSELLSNWSLTLSGLSNSAAGAWSDLQAGIDSAWAGFDSAVQAGQDAITGYLHDQWMAIPEDIRADLLEIASLLQERFDEYLSIAREKGEEIRADIQARFDEAREAVSSALAEARAAVQRELDEIVSIVSSRVASARARFGEIAQGVEARIEAARAVVQQKFDQIKLIVESRLDAARQAIDSKIAGWRAAAEARIQELVDAGHRALEPLIERVRAVADRATQALRDGLARAKEAVLSPLREAAASVSEAAADAVQRAQQMGTNIVTGIVGGLRAAKQAVVDAVLGMIREALDGALAFLKSKSPSRLFWDRVGMPIPQGVAGGIIAGTPLAVAAALAMVQAVAAAGEDITPFSSRDFFLVDEAAEREFLDRSLAVLDQLASEAERARQLVEGARQSIQDAFGEFFTQDPKAGGLAEIVSQIERLAKTKLGADFFSDAGLDAQSFEDIRRQIEALAGEPKQQEELWKALIDGLSQRWSVYYDQQLGREEDKAAAIKKSIDLAKRDDPAADVEDLESDLQRVQDKIDALKEKNELVVDSIKAQTFEVGNQFDRYDRLAKLADQRAAAEQRVRQELARQVEERQELAEDAETQASDLALQLLEDELAAEAAAHELRLQQIDERIAAEEQAIKDAALAEDERHAQALANITAEVDARQAAADAEASALTRAKNILDSFAKGNAVTDEQKDFLRSLGLDPEQLGKATTGLSETMRQVDALQTLLGRLDKKSSERITKDQISAAERDALEQLRLNANLTDAERRRIDIALQSKGGISQKQLAALLERAAGDEKGAEGFLTRQLLQQEEGIDLLDQEIARREAAAKVTQDALDLEREGLQGLIDAEDQRHADAKRHAEDRLAALQAERDLEEQTFERTRRHLEEAQRAEELRHDERMKALQEEFALELLRLGKTEEEVAEILRLQRERAAAIAEEARRRAEEAKSSAVAGPEGAAPPPAERGDPPPFTPVPITPILPPGTGRGLVDALGGIIQEGTSTGFAAALDQGLRDVLGGQAGVGRDLASMLIDPAIASAARLHSRLLDIRGLATELGLPAGAGGGNTTVDRSIVFNGPVTIDRELAEEIGLVGAARAGAP